MHREKAEKAFSEARKERKWREMSERNLSAAESRQVSAFCIVRRQKRLSRKLEWSEVGVRRLKGTSQLLRAGKLVCFSPEKAEKAVSEFRMQRKWREMSERNLSAAESRQVSAFCIVRRQKRLSRRLERSESGARCPKGTSQLLRAGELARFAS